MTYVGLDIETTGLDLARNHRLIQIGLCMIEGDNWVYDVLPIGDIMIDATAMAVNKFSLERVGQGMPQAEVDAHLYEHLHKEFKPASLTAVGWNVGSFDIPFVKKELPQVASLFSHRVCDLSGIAMLEGAKRNEDWRNIKERWHKKAEESLGEIAKWHDALWDARAALAVWQLLVHGGLQINEMF